MVTSSLLLPIALAAALAAVLCFGLFALCRKVRQRRERLQAQERLRRLEEEAIQEERRRRQARMTHDLKAPIHALLGMADLLAESDLDAGQREQVRTLRSSAEFLLALVRGILDLERLEAGALEMRHEDFSLRRLVAETVDLFQAEAAARGLEIRIRISEEVSDALRGDPLRVRQVLVNLLSNAVKFTPAREAPDRAKIEVRIDREGDPAGEDRWRCAVSDPGVGMTPQTVERLFEPFSQADTTLVRTSGGSGLGLAICRHLVAALGGEIGCESTRGEGSTFFFSLPLVPAEGDPAAAPQAPVERFRGRVLVVDDEAVNRRIARAHLEALGVEVVEAESGVEALERLAEEEFALLLTDLRMPGLDGLALTRRVRRRERQDSSERLPIVAVSAQGEETRSEERRAGIDDRLAKPFRRGELAALLRRWLSSAEIEEEGALPLEPWQETRAALVTLGETTGEDELAKAVAAFRESSARHLEAIETAWRAGEWEALRDPLHGLSGSAEFLGGREVVTTLSTLQEYAQARRPFHEALFHQLRREVDGTARNFAAPSSAAGG